MTRVVYLNMKLKFKVKSTAYEYTLYQAGEVEVQDDDPADPVRGYSVVGHYSNIEGLLRGVREKILKHKTKRARDLDAFLHTVIGSQQEILGEIKKQAFLASKRKAPAGGAE